MLDVDVDELLDAAADVAAGKEGAVLAGTVAVESFFSPVLVALVSLALLAGGFSLSE